MKNRGFTIVELLIVVVVIAILAAITIVAYNGIQARTKNSAASTTAQSAAKKVLSYMAINSDQVPATLADAGVGDQGSTSYQYSTNTTTAPQSFCVTATVNGVSYYINNTNVTSPQPGVCAGQSANGVATITNLVVNPSAEIDLTGWEFAGNGNGLVQQQSRPTSGGQSGGAFARMAITTAPSSMSGLGIWVASYGTLPSTNSTQYMASMYVRSSQPLQIGLNAVPYQSNWSYTGGEVYGSTVTLAPDTWTRLSVPITVPAGSQYLRVRARLSGTTAPPANTTIDADAAMLTSGSTLYTYADGASNNWAWTGAAHNSSSVGMPLP